MVESISKKNSIEVAKTQKLKSREETSIVECSLYPAIGKAHKLN